MTTKPYFSYLGLTNADPQRIAEAGMTIIDRLQHFKPHEQALSAAAVFLLLCEEIRIAPQDVMVPIKNLLMSAHAGTLPEIRALQMYIKEELAK